MITSMLNAAEPTIVDGPSSPDRIPRPQISITESRISGADEPSAISVRLATVSFHTLTRKRRVVPSMICFTVYVCDVTCSIAVMKMSATIATPKKVHRRSSR